MIGFASRSNQNALQKVGAITKTTRAVDRRNFEISANDKRFLRSLRIAADEAAGEGSRVGYEPA